MPITSIYNYAIMIICYYPIQVNYQSADGSPKAANVYAYYVEGDWGNEHNRLPSLVYNQMFDLMNPYDVAKHGTVTIQARGSYQACTFTYDYSD